MKRHSLWILVLAALAFIAGCGSGDNVASGDDATPDPEGSTVATTAPIETPAPTVAATPEPTAEPEATATPAPTAAPAPTATPRPEPTPAVDPAAEAEQRALLADARARWQANRPGEYFFELGLICECDGGPWQVVVNEDGTATSRHLGDALGNGSPHLSIDSIFDTIEAALDDGSFPVEVTYDELGVPVEYVFNRPQIPVDGGFVLEVRDFTAGAPDDGRADDAAALAAARDQWEASGLADDHVYTFTSVCFCPPEYVGPYQVEVTAGQVTSATYEGTDLLELEILNIDSYDDLVLTVDEVFDEIERGIAEADSYTVTYHPELGYPTSAFIDWDERIADEEAGYQIENLESPTRGCSVATVNLRLEDQPDLPAEVASRRQLIFDTAMTCDLEALAELTDPSGFNASFGGGTPFDVWTAAEQRGETVLLDLVRLLNTDFAVDGEGEDAFYIWPSAFVDLEAPDGTGISAEAYQELLAIYTADDLEDMFDGLGGYVGYRIGIDANGNWRYFVAGD